MPHQCNVSNMGQAGCGLRLKEEVHRVHWGAEVFEVGAGQEEVLAYRMLFRAGYKRRGCFYYS